MIFTYNFSIKKLCDLLNENLSRCGDNGMNIDADLLYYYLRQKYAPVQIQKIANKLNELSDMPSYEIDKKMRLFANYNGKTTKV